MNNIAVDIGYSAVKAVSKSGKRITFPSVVAPGSENPLNGLFRKGVEHRVSVRPYLGSKAESKRFLVGDAALHALSATATLSREKPVEMHDVLLVTTAYLLGAGRTELAVGLPLAYYRNQKDTLRRRLESLSVWVSVNGGPEEHVAFNRVVVVPQGVGAAFAVKDEYPDGGYVGLLDIGCYTTDYLLFESKGGSLIPIPGAHGSFEIGVYLVQRALADAYQGITGAPLPSRRQGEVLLSAASGEKVRYRGQAIELTDAYREAQAAVGQQIIHTIMAEWGDRADSLASVILVGGGALVFADAFKELNAEVPAEPTFANAIGFLHMLGV